MIDSIPMSLFETIALIVAATMACIILGTGLGQILVVARGIRAMEAATVARSKDMDKRHKEAMDGLAAARTADERRHKEAMDASAAVRAELAEAGAADERRHKEAMDGLAEARTADERRHKEAMDGLAEARTADDKRHTEAMDGLAEARAADDKRHTESMAALQELIRRTSPPAEHPGD